MAIESEEKEVEDFLEVLKDHFTRAGGTRTEVQKRAQKEALLKQMGDKATDISEGLLDVATNMQMVENIYLLANHSDVGFVGVNMYCDDQAQLKDLPINQRASQIAEVCGKMIQT
ncbi:predicted protein [Haematococcus lacustris]|uniref:Uncharacterized protein n=1 Tax=Haematococcus lacustris TaxID=44745 RepID=A0A6A0A183_HAELA|nr:predicted protein [Haematococcus lacustris]